MFFASVTCLSRYPKVVLSGFNHLAWQNRLFFLLACVATEGPLVIFPFKSPSLNPLLKAISNLA